MVSAFACSMALYAGEAKISFELILNPVISHGIVIDSAQLILLDEDDAVIHRTGIAEDSIAVSFDNLDAGKYSLKIRLFQNDYILAENLCSGYLNGNETRNVSGDIVFACAYPILHLKWNQDGSQDVNAFYNYSIDPDSNFLKRYPLENLDSLSASFRETGVRYYRRYSVNWGLLDSNLIPIVPYSFGDYRNPVTTCHTASAFFDDYMEYQDSLSLLGFMNNANWLLENCDSNYYLHYEFSYKHSSRVLDKGWVTGMAQGLALNTLSMAYALTEDQKYLEGAKGIFETMHKNKGPYFCFGIDREDYYWLEEYPNPDFCHVLNGKVSGLWGLWSYYTITGDHFARILLEAGIKTLVDNFPLWNIQNQDYSYYCLHHLAYSHYHEAHKDQLRYFGNYFGVDELLNGADCFSNSYFEAYPASLHVDSWSSSSEITVISPLSWDVSTNADWLTLQKNDNGLTVNCQQNPSTLERSGNIAFVDSSLSQLQVLRVIQDPEHYVLLSNTDTLYVSDYPGHVLLNVQADTIWSAYGSAYWIQTERLNDTLLYIHFQENTEPRERTALLEIYLEDSTFFGDIKVVQHSADPVLSLQPDSILLPAEAGEFTVDIEANDSWEFAYEAFWITAVGMNDSSLIIKYLNNPDFIHPRMMYLTVYLRDSTLVKRLKIKQKSALLYLNVYPDSITVWADSGSIGIGIQSPLNWTTDISDAWLKAYQQNDSLLFLKYEMNGTGEDRSARIEITLNDTLSKTIRITQFSRTAGMTKNPGNTVMEIFPNPSNKRIFLRLANNEAGLLNTEIYNLVGKLVLDRKIPFQNGFAELDVSSVPPGLYLLKITIFETAILKKVIIE